MKKIKITFIFILGLLNNLKSQSPILNEYIKQGIESNLSLKQENLEIEKALKSIDLAKANLSPKIAFAPNYTLAAGGRKLNFPIGDLLNPVYSTLNALTKSQNFPQVENVNQQLAPNNFHDTKFTVQYPVFNPEIKYNIALQKEILQTEYAKKKYLEYELAHNIETAYFQYLLANEAIGIYQNARKTLVEVETLNQKLVNNNVALKDVVLSAQFEVSKIDQEITSATKNANLAKSYFNFLINKPFSETVNIDTTLINNYLQTNPLSFYLQSAQQNRPEFNQIQSGLNVNSALITLQEKSAKLPQFFVGGNAGFQGFGYNLGNNQAYALAQFGMQWDIFHGHEKKIKIEQSKISKSILSIKKDEVSQQIALQVNQNFLELESAISNLKIQKTGIEKTKKILEIVNTRYKNGTAIFLELIKAQNDYLSSVMTETLAKYDVLNKYAILKKSSGINTL